MIGVTPFRVLNSTYNLLTKSTAPPSTERFTGFLLQGSNLSHADKEILFTMDRYYGNLN